MQNVIHGLIKSFETEMITEASLLEEVDITSSELTINTLDFKVYSEDDDFNIFNPGGMYSVLQKNSKPLTLKVILMVHQRLWYILS